MEAAVDVIDLETEHLTESETRIEARLASGRSTDLSESAAEEGRMSSPGAAGHADENLHRGGPDAGGTVAVRTKWEVSNSNWLIMRLMWV